MKTESSQRSQGIGQFINWLTENGARVDGLSIAEFSGYDLGLKAETDFAENQLILEIPRALIFSTYTAASELIILQNDPLVQHMPQVALAIALLIEKHKENSEWKPYLDMLPSSYNTVLYMKTNEMIELKGSPTLGKIINIKIGRIQVGKVASLLVERAVKYDWFLDPINHVQLLSRLATSSDLNTTIVFTIILANSADCRGING